MGESLTYECRAFLQAAVTGAAAAVLYALVRSLVRGRKRSANIIPNTLFWAAFASIWFFMTFRFTKGYFRAYELLALGLGAAVVSLAAGDVLVRIFDKFIDFFGLILKYLLTPARFLYKILFGRKRARGLPSDDVPKP